MIWVGGTSWGGEDETERTCRERKWKNQEKDTDEKEEEDKGKKR